MKYKCRKPTRGRPRGYRPPAHTLKQIHLFSKTKLYRSVISALGDHLLILTCAFSAFCVLLNAPVYASMPANLLALLVIASRQRGLENLVHEAAHRNWTRGNPLHERWELNDRLGNFLAALPLFSTVDGFRLNHDPHHSNFGSDMDRDNTRYQELDIENFNDHREAMSTFFVGLMTRLHPYSKSWWANIRTTKSTTFKAFGWHTGYILAITIVAGLLTGQWLWAAWCIPVLWLLYWLLPMILFLTPLRFLAEADKHSYQGTKTVFDGTFTNVGLFERFIHPHHDGYHLVHHLFPSIPHHQLKRAHLYLVGADPQYAARSRQRNSVFKKPISGLEGISFNLSELENIPSENSQACSLSEARWPAGDRCGPSPWSQSPTTLGIRGGKVNRLKDTTSVDGCLTNQGAEKASKTR